MKTWKAARNAAFPRFSIELHQARPVFIPNAALEDDENAIKSLGDSRDSKTNPGTVSAR
jgi:hypothetical protein